ncbi:Gfo/Idh/MocA family protein [Paenibacillus sacheonensis]|uniref:Gfo/Idh/MocA family oxidoreductase n=1 Tax=Paenibacillus sacheonensis TaxID=742054 RepID=A0A7X4YJV2_9BACL|nr:Gfo/Idh/MocA family oxidoreductase [Paenibacillus sacheonensis]MBM7564051.1 putative dehydrogenase [Paenibacillus sacheonensis]NBC67617.1 Gfo/Idh/MocA family oxidoreductase [Paenibacillus sacheonensis]
MKLKAVLAGTKGWADAHAKAYQASERIELVGICGHSNTERLKALADRYGIAARTLDLETLLRETNPDIVDIVSSPDARLELVKTAVRFPSVKLINIEKPMALTPSEAYEIEALCKAHGKLALVNHQHKYLPAWHKAQQLLRAGAIGEIEFIRASTKVNIMEQGSHVIDMVMYFNDFSPIAWVMGQTGPYEGKDSSSIVAPDEAMASILFANGVRATVECGAFARSLQGETNPFYHIGVDAYGTEGHLKIALNQTLEVRNYITGEHTVEKSSWDEHHFDALLAYVNSIPEYLANPEGGHICDLAHAMLSFQVIMAIYHTAEYGGKVELPRRFEDGIVERFADKAAR